MVHLEIIAASLEDARAAYAGGATRLEVVFRLDTGGLTPSLELAAQIAQSVPIPARIMLRENEGFEITGAEELEILKSKARALADLNVDGLVIGFTKNGRLDVEALRQIIAAAPSMRYTVHNAIERAADPIEALRVLRDFPQVDRALVTGGAGSLEERIERWSAYERAFGPERHLIAGGLTLAMLESLRRSTNLREFHFGRAVRVPEEHAGKVDAQKVKKAKELLTRVG